MTCWRRRQTGARSTAPRAACPALLLAVLVLGGCQKQQDAPRPALKTTTRSAAQSGPKGTRKR